MIKTRDVPTELRNFNSVFNKLIFRYEASRIFEDLLNLIIACLARGTEEKQYFEIIKRYEREEIELFCKLFAELIMYYDKNISDSSWCDPLGEYYEILAGNYKKSALGQFFTPPAICDLMASFVIDSENWGKSVNEPACGSGRMVLAANKICKGNRYTCQDKDPICAKMTAINLAFHKINGVVYCMDAILIDKPRATYIINHELYKHKLISILQP